MQHILHIKERLKIQVNGYEYQRCNVQWSDIHCLLFFANEYTFNSIGFYGVTSNQWQSINWTYDYPNSLTHISITKCSLIYCWYSHLDWECLEDSDNLVIDSWLATQRQYDPFDWSWQWFYLPWFPALFLWTKLVKQRRQNYDIKWWEVMLLMNSTVYEERNEIAHTFRWCTIFRQNHVYGIW